MTILLRALDGKETGLYFADSTSLKVCRNKRIYQHKIVKGLAKRGKSSMGWFYSLKLHLIINMKGEIMAVKITPGNTDDLTVLRDFLRTLTNTFISVMVLFILYPYKKNKLKIRKDLINS
jgi:hypothetical protein